MKRKENVPAGRRETEDLSQSPSFVKRTQRPFVFLNVAISADGKLATENRKVSSCGSKRDKEHMMELRATADAVMSSARTVDLGPVTLGPGPKKYQVSRVKRGLARLNVRIVVSGRGTINPGAEIFKRRLGPVIVLTTGAASKARLRRLEAVADEVRICGAREINFPETLEWLRSRWKVKRLLCEGAGELNDALLRAGLIDELHLTICPRIFGGREAPTLADGRGAASLAAATRMRLVSAKRIGGELFLVYRTRRGRKAREGNRP